MSHLLPSLTEAFQSHLTVWALAFAAAVVIVERLAAPRKRGIKLLVGLVIAHVAAVAIAGVGAGVIDIVGEVSLLARLLAGWIVVLGMGTIVFEVMLPRLGVFLSRIIEDLTVFGAVAVISLLVLRRGGVDVTGIVATSAVVTAVIGLSLQDTLGNTIGGLTLQLDDSIHTGDWIRVGDVVGRVKEVRWRFTAVETRNWETVFIPNSKLVKGDVTVLGKRHRQPRQWRRWVYFNVDFRHAPTTVIDTVLGAVTGAGIDNMAADPKPSCVLMDFGESTARYAVRYWLTDLGVDDPTDSAVRIRIYFALQRAGIPLALPAHALFLTENSQKRRDRKQKQAHVTRLQRLHRVDVFAPLDDDEREQIADMLVRTPFSRGECITRQGAEAHWLYLVGQGQVSVRVEVDGLEKQVATMGDGEVFGEMSLLTGEPRAASVYALTDVECWRLDRDAFKLILAERPDVATPIAALLAERRVQLQAVREGLDAESHNKRVMEEQSRLLDKMRQFFGL
jgi:small-conductance mechanosensitive channel/CRP-like cAMP-binding protein